MPGDICWNLFWFSFLEKNKDKDAKAKVKKGIVGAVALNNPLLSSLVYLHVCICVQLSAPSCMNEYLFVWLEQSPGCLNIFFCYLACPKSDMVHAPFLEMVYKRQLNTFILTLQAQTRQTNTHPRTDPCPGRSYFLFNNLCWRRMAKWRGLSSTRTRTTLPSPAPLWSELLPACMIEFRRASKSNSKSNSKIWTWCSKNLKARHRRQRLLWIHGEGDRLTGNTGKTRG